MFSKNLNVLIVPAPTEIGLEILDALKSIKGLRLIGGGVEAPNVAQHLLDDYLIIPSAHDDQFLEKLNLAIEKFSIDYVFGTHDDVLLKLARHEKVVKAKVLSSPVKTVEICSYKRKTYEHLASYCRVPASYNMSDLANTDFPLFVKPNRGQGSNGAIVVHNLSEAKAHCASIKDPVVSEFLPGREYTVDCFSSRTQGLMFCSGRERSNIRNGISVTSTLVEHPEFEIFAAQISSRLTFHGAWFFQVKENPNGALTLMEIGPRIAGTMALNRARGVNFPLLTLLEAENKSLKIITTDWPQTIVRSLKNHFPCDFNFRHLYIDLDDTILLNGKTNLQAISLIHQCINDQISVHLITRHASDLQITLETHRLIGLFDTVIHLTKNEPKSSSISAEDSIFVDDSFAERQEVSQNSIAQVFDVSQIGILLR